MVAHNRKQFSPEKIKYFTPDQVNLFLQASKINVRDNAILTLSYYHALRISEVGYLQLSDIDLESRRLHTRRLKHGINASYRLGDESFKSLKQWLAIRGTAPGPLFPSRKSVIGIGAEGSKGIGKGQLNNLFILYSRKAGIKLAKRQNFHTLRHSCAVHMVDKDIPIVQIKDWLGHRSIQSTQIYAVVSDMKRDETAERFYNNQNGKETEQTKQKDTESQKESFTNQKEETKKEPKEKKQKKGTGIDWKRNIKAG